MKDDQNNPQAYLKQTTCEWPMSRRDFVRGATAVVGATTLAPTLVHAAADGAPPPEAKQIPLSLTINGEPKQMMVDPEPPCLTCCAKT